MKFTFTKRKYIPIIVIVFAFFALRAWQQNNLAHGLVPDFSSKTLTNQILSTDQLKQATLIHFWATWCNICEIENASIQSISNDYNTINIAMSSGSDKDIIKYAQKNNIKLDNIINDNNSSIAKLFGVRGVPSSFIVNKDNQIKFIEVGYTTEIGLRLRLWWTQL